MWHPRLMAARWTWCLQLAAVSRGQDDLGDQVGAQAELLRDLFRAPPLLVVEQREFLLRLGPRPGDVTGRRAGLCWPGLCWPGLCWPGLRRPGVANAPLR